MTKRPSQSGLLRAVDTANPRYMTTQLDFLALCETQALNHEIAAFNEGSAVNDGYMGDVQAVIRDGKDPYALGAQRAMEAVRKEISSEPISVQGPWQTFIAKKRLYD